MSQVAVKVETNLHEFNRTLAQYIGLTKLTPTDALLKQGTKLTYALSKRFGGLKPGKGEITAARRRDMAAGLGLNVREAARAFAFKHTIGTAQNIRTKGMALFMEKTKRGKLKTDRGQKKARTWWQIAVDRELSIRESGRGYVSFAARMGNLERAFKDGRISEKKQLDRISREIGRVGLRSAANDSALTFTFNNANIVEGINRPKGRAAVAASLADVRADMLVYIQRKLAENAKKSGMN